MDWTRGSYILGVTFLPENLESVSQTHTHTHTEIYLQCQRVPFKPPQILGEEPWASVTSDVLPGIMTLSGITPAGWGSSTQDNQCEHRTGEKKKTAKSLLPAPVTSALVRPGKKEDALIDGEGGPPISERNYSDDSEGRSYGQLVDWQLHHENVPAPASCLVQSFLAKHQITQVTQPPTAQIWRPVTSGFS
nr:uncharacterized protein LOC128779380 isoform X2 [Desmodus rotundus]